MSYALDLKRFSEKINKNLDQTSRAIKIKLFNGVINDTRVDTGRLTGNWQTSTGQPILVETDRLDKTGSQARAEAEANVGAFTVDYLTNNLDYAEVWEERDGMIAKNMTRIQRIVAEESA